MALHDIVLLRCVWRYELATHAELRVVLNEVCHDELSTMVRAKSQQLLARLAFFNRLDVLDHHHNHILGGEQRHPHLMGEVIDGKENVPVPAWHCRRNWPAQVSMEKLEHFSRPPQRLLWKQHASMLARDTGFTNLLHLSEQGQDTDQPVSRHIAQHGEVKVAESSMLDPSVLVSARRQTD